MKTAVATTAGVAAASQFPYIKTTFAQAPITWKVQSGFATRDELNISFLDWAKKVDEMSGGRLKIDILPSGAVVGTFDIIDGVNRGVLDGGYAVPAYWYSRNAAFSLFGTGPSFGMDAIDVLSWYYYGGGFDMYQDLLTQMRMNVVGFLLGPMPTQPLGWFRTPVLNPDQLKRTKYRTVGLSADLFGLLGASVVTLPGGEIVPALERGVIDAAEFNNPTSDKALGFPDVRKVYMLQSYHQPVENLEFIVNKGKWEPLPADLKAIVRGAVFAESADFQYKMIDRNSRDLIEFEQKRGVRVYITPKSVLEAQLKAWDTLIDKNSKTNPTFAKIVASQKAWARRVVSWKLRVFVDNKPAFDHFFKK
ncbi:MAG: C4-dicarboxylate ABC transporter [Armatimonadetes bacterium RBG_19FT_COMBO_69_19]|nr:MAG: C4-dicarboxylate ABC transporter [Armatimonadetes bacterium RBG_19FT_COMBO_69_19]